MKRYKIEAIASCNVKAMSFEDACNLLPSFNDPEWNVEHTNGGKMRTGLWHIDCIVYRFEYAKNEKKAFQAMKHETDWHIHSFEIKEI